jgi:hypothetical protein
LQRVFLGVTKYHYRVTLSHASPLEDLDSVLVLGQEHVVRGVCDIDVEEVM